MNETPRAWFDDVLGVGLSVLLLPLSLIWQQILLPVSVANSLIWGAVLATGWVYLQRRRRRSEVAT